MQTREIASVKIMENEFFLLFCSCICISFIFVAPPETLNVPTSVPRVYRGVRDREHADVRAGTALHCDVSVPVEVRRVSGQLVRTGA